MKNAEFLALAISVAAPRFGVVAAFQLSPMMSEIRHGTVERRFAYRRSHENNEEDDEEDDDEPPQVDINDFRAPSSLSFGFNKGRSSPSQRKAMGRSASSVTKIHICTNCGSEFVKWMGRCPTCKEWNTLQEHAVLRQEVDDSPFGVGGGGKPMFGGAAGRPNSWLDGVLASTPGAAALGRGAPVRVTDLYPKKGASGPSNRRRERIVVPSDDEFNTVLGGGIMPGSLVLVGGDPGVGKSTLMLQIAGAIAETASPTPAIGMGLPENFEKDAAQQVGPVWYCSGEENVEQIAERARRLGIDSSELWLLTETHADSLCAQVVQHMQPAPLKAKGSPSLQDEDGNDYDDHSSDGALPPLPPSLLVIDSIQTMICDAGGKSGTGGVAQVRAGVTLFLRLAKSTGIPVMLVGHVTKDGDVAGPRTIEHMVDVVLYLEGSADPSPGMSHLRVLRASKNRFGSSDEAGVYEMTAGRLLPVTDPSSLFLSHRVSVEDTEGCAISIQLEGMRAMAIEVQALVTSAASNSGYGQQTVDGMGPKRLKLLMAVLNSFCGVSSMTRNDIYINVVGGIRLDQGEGKAADLAVAVALASSHLDIGVRADTAFVGEVGLKQGELRPVVSIEKRLQEARRMGFSRVVSAMDSASLRKRLSSNRATYSNSGVYSSQHNGIEWVQCRTLRDALEMGLAEPVPKRRKKKPKSTGTGGSGGLGLEDIGDIEGEFL